MKRGDHVLIYKDPITMTIPEGRAIIQKIIGETQYHGTLHAVNGDIIPIYLQTVEVVFGGEKAPYIRTIRIANNPERR
ncbi:MAG: hypothetical protein HZA02_02770 [Nitrospinae bacterium]|nr:hypothetical protein [Nitrospinota bacterium]